MVTGRGDRVQSKPRNNIYSSSNSNWWLPTPVNESRFSRVPCGQLVGPLNTMWPKLLTISLPTSSITRLC